jgi:hypothetical protein
MNHYTQVLGEARPNDKKAVVRGCFPGQAVNGLLIRGRTALASQCRRVRSLNRDGALG